MQTELAMDIFEHVFGKGSRFKLVANVDWSQNHAATADDALDAEKMIVGTGGQSAKHIRATSYPIRENQRRTSPGFGLQIPSSNSVRFRPSRGRIRFGFEGVGAGFGSVPASRSRIRFGFGAREPDSVRFLRLETRFGSVWPDRISGRRLWSGFRWVLGGLLVY